MKKLSYIIEFEFQEKRLSLGIINEKKIISSENILSVYYQLTKVAEEFAHENSLKIDIIPATSLTPTELKDISEYIFLDSSFNKNRFKRHLLWLKERESITIFPIRIRTLVPSDELVGRGELIQNLLSLIKDHNISLRAPRCYGKTSILNAVLEEPPKGYITRFIQTRNLSTPESFLGTIAYELKEGTPLERQKEREKFEKKGKESLLKTANLLFEKEKNYLLLLDEFNQFLMNLKENNEQFSRFSDLFTMMKENKNIKFILASSESERKIIGEELSTRFFSNFEEIDVPPLNIDDASLLLEELAYNSRVIPAKKEIDKILCNLIRNFIPYFIHIFVSIWKGMIKKEERPSPEEVYEEMIGNTGWNLLREFQELPKRYPGRLSNSAKVLLYEIAKKDDGVLSDKAQSIFTKETGSKETRDFISLIDRLKDDLLIDEKDDRYIFRSKILMDFWRRFPTT